MQGFLSAWTATVSGTVGMAADGITIRNSSVLDGINAK